MGLNYMQPDQTPEDLAAFRKPGVFPTEFSEIIKNAFEVRTDSDYQEFYIVSKEKVTAQIENAKTFLEAVEKYINAKIQRK